MKRHNSFTLIELLVIIAIIGLLASIVVVNVNSSREKAQTAKTVAFSQQIYHALGADAAGYWDFNEIVSGNQVRDVSGNGNTGTIVSSPSLIDSLPFSGGSFGKALSFDGVDDFVRVSHNASLNFGTGNFTLEFWIKRQGAFTGTYDYAAILGKIYLHPEYAGSYGWLLSIPSYSSSVVAPIWRNVDGFFVGPNISLPMNSWTHVVYAISRSGSAMNVKLYTNGVFSNQVNFTSSNSFDNNEPLKIYASGGNWGDYIVKAPSLIDEVRIYRQTLTLTQIQQHYAEGLPRHNNLAQK